MAKKQLEKIQEIEKDIQESKKNPGSKFDSFIDKYFKPNPKADYLDVFTLAGLLLYGSLKLISKSRIKYKKWKRRARLTEAVNKKSRAIAASRNRNIIYASNLDEMSPEIRENARQIAKNMIKGKNPAVNGRSEEKLTLDIAKNLQLRENVRNEQNGWVQGWRAAVEKELNNEIVKGQEPPSRSVQISKEYIDFVNSDLFLTRQVNARTEQYVKETIRENPAFDGKEDELRRQFFNTAYEQAMIDRQVINEQYAWQYQTRANMLNQIAELEEGKKRENAEKAKNAEKGGKAENAEKGEKAEKGEEAGKADDAGKGEEAGDAEERENAGDAAEDLENAENRQNEANEAENARNGAGAEERDNANNVQNEANEAENAQNGGEAGERDNNGNDNRDHNEIKAPKAQEMKIPRWWSGDVLDAYLQTELKEPPKGAQESKPRKEFRESVERLAKATKDPGRKNDMLVNEYVDAYVKASNFNQYLDEHPDSPEHQKGASLSKNVFDVLYDQRRIDQYIDLQEKDQERVNNIAQRIAENKAPLDRNKAPLEKENLEKNNIKKIDDRRAMERERRSLRHQNLRHRDQNQMVNNGEAAGLGMG